VGKGNKEVEEYKKEGPAPRGKDNPKPYRVHSNNKFKRLEGATKKIIGTIRDIKKKNSSLKVKKKERSC